MKTNRSYWPGSVLLLPVLFLCLVLLGGCTYAIMPKALPPVKGYDRLSLSGVSLIVVNAEKDAAERDILTPKKGRSGLRGNRQAWTKRLVESLSRELAVRGARVRSDAPLVLSLAVPEITFGESRDQIQFFVKTAVSLSTGWTKEYEGVAAASTRSAGSLQIEADRLAGQALADAVTKMLGDPAFLDSLGNKQ
jgi:hypothetical protein